MRAGTMLRWGLSILGIALVLMLILSGPGGLDSCGPGPGMMPVLIGYMVLLPLGALLTLIALIRLALNRFCHRGQSQAMPRDPETL